MDLTKDDVIQIAKQAAQEIYQASAAQNASQIAQQVGEQVSQLIAKINQSQVKGTGVTDTFTRQENADIGGAERIEKDNYTESAILFGGRHGATLHHELSMARLDQAGYQALLNNVENANALSKAMIKNMEELSKQHLAHRDVATDNLWNPIQIGAADTLTARAVSIDDTSLKAIGAAVAAAIADSLKPKS